VPPLGAERRFSVITPSAKVIVHGTRFSVSTNPGDTAAGAALGNPAPGIAAQGITETAEAGTCVRVTEGRVEVISAQGRRFLTDGQQWGCETSGTPEPAVSDLEGMHEVSGAKRASGAAAN